MSLVSNEKLTELTNSSNGKINEQVITFAKTFLYSQLKNYITDEALLKQIKEKLEIMNIKLLSSDEFKKVYYNSNGKGFLPGAFVYKETIYFKNEAKFENDDFHKLIHEMLHFISHYEKDDKFYKSGLLIINKEKNYSYGYCLNEAFTEHLTSILLDESFTGYSKDLDYLIQLFMLLTNLQLEDLLHLYLSNKEWCTEDIINKFNSSKNSLIDFMSMLDNKLAITRKSEFNRDELFNIIFDSIKQNVDNKEYLDTDNLRELLKTCYHYYND